MRVHAVLASATLVSAGVAVLVALGYAWFPRLRQALRRLLLASAAAAALLALAAAPAGSALLRELETAAHPREVAAAQAHAQSADGFAIAILCHLVVVLASAWGALRPGRAEWGAAMWAGAALLTATAIATVVTGGEVLDAALGAVALKNAK